MDLLAEYRRADLPKDYLRRRRISDQEKFRKEFSEERIRLLECSMPKIRNAFQFGKLYVFGSTANYTADVASDLDILVTGLEAEKMIQFLLYLEKISGLTIDLHLDDEKESFVRDIMIHGLEING